MSLAESNLSASQVESNLNKAQQKTDDEDDEPEITVGYPVRFVQEYKDNWEAPNVNIGTIGKVVIEHKSYAYKGRYDVELLDGTVVQRVPPTCLEVMRPE